MSPLTELRNPENDIEGADVHITDLTGEDDDCNAITWLDTTWLTSHPHETSEKEQKLQTCRFVRSSTLRMTFFPQDINDVYKLKRLSAFKI